MKWRKKFELFYESYKNSNIVIYSSYRSVYLYFLVLVCKVENVDW
jgi:hypothetical protein